MDLKRYQQQLAELVAQPSVSCTIDSIDQSNRGVIDLLAQWFSERGFETSVFAVDSDQTKYNLVAKLGSGEDGLVLSGHTDTVPFDQQKWHQEDQLKLEN